MLAILLLSTLQAARRGIFVEAFSLAGIVAGIGIASWNYQRMVPWVHHWFGRWVWQVALQDALSFLAIALGVMLLAGIIGRVIRWSMRTIGLGWADRLMGAIFGLCRGAVLVTLGVMLLVAFWPGSGVLKGSRLGPWFAAVARATTVATPAALEQKVRYGESLLRAHTPVLVVPGLHVPQFGWR
jgi:membrane protein required for colicin V production